MSLQVCYGRVCYGRVCFWAGPLLIAGTFRRVVVEGRSTGSRGGGSTYELGLLVRYDVDGVTLGTDRDAFDSVRNHTPGARMPVRHDPADPGCAVLRAEGGWIPFVLPFGLLAISIVCALFGCFAKPPPMLETIEIPPGVRRLGTAPSDFSRSARSGWWSVSVATLEGSTDAPTRGTAASSRGDRATGCRPGSTLPIRPGLASSCPGPIWTPSVWYWLSFQ